MLQSSGASRPAHPKQSSIEVRATHSSHNVLGRGYGDSSDVKVCPSGHCVSRALLLCNEVLARICFVPLVSAIITVVLLLVEFPTLLTTTFEPFCT